MLNLKNNHLELVKELPSFSEERYLRSLVAKFSGEYSTEKFNEKFTGYLEKTGNIPLSVKHTIDDYLVLTSKHPSHNANALFDIPLIYLLFNQPEISFLMSPKEIVELVAIQRANATIYDRKRIYPIILQKDLITDIFCQAYSYSGDFAIDGAPLVYILNTSSFQLMEKMTSEQKIAIIKNFCEFSFNRVHELYVSDFDIEAPTTSFSLLQKIFKTVEKEYVSSCKDLKEKQFAVMLVYLMRHGYSFELNGFVLNKLVVIKDNKAYLTNNKTLFTALIGEAVVSTALTLMKNMFRVLRGKNINKYELHDIIVGIKDNTPVHEAISLLLGEEFIPEFCELVEKIGSPPFDRTKTEYLIDKYFDLKTLGPQKALSFLYINGGVSGVFLTSFELHVIRNSFSLVRKEVEKEIALRHLSAALAEDNRSIAEDMTESDGLQLFI